MSKRCFAAAWTVLALLPATINVRAAEKAELFDAETGIRSKVTVTQDEMQVATDDGVIYVYERDAEHDGPQSYCYYNATLDQALRWPREPNGALMILKPGATRYQRSEMQIVNRRGAIVGGEEDLSQAEGLSAYLIDETDDVEPRGQLQLAHIHPADDGMFDAEFISWEQEAYEYEVERHVVEEVVIGGRTRQVERTVTELVAAIRPRFALSTLTLSFEQMTAFLPNGTELDNDALRQLIGRGAPVVMVSDLAQGDVPHRKLDARLVRLLRPRTLIIVYDSAAELSPPRDLAPGEAGREYPATPIEFGGAIVGANGDVVLSKGGYDIQEQVYTVKVPVSESRIVNGKEVQVTTIVEEQRTRSVAVWNSDAIPHAAGECELFELSGAPLSPMNATRRLRDQQTVVFVGLGAELDPWYRNLLRSKMLLLASKAPGGPGPSPFRDPDRPRMPEPKVHAHDGVATGTDRLFARFARKGARSLVGEYSQLNPENDWHRGAISVAGTTATGVLKLRWTNHAGASWGLTPDLPNRVLNCGPDNPYHDHPEARTFQIVLGQDADGEPVVAGFHFQDRAGFVRQETRDAAAQLTADAAALKRPDGNHAEAIAKYRAALRLNPLFVPALHDLGIALRETGRPEEALEPLSSALELDDRDAMIWYNRAFTNADLGESQAALHDIRRAIDLRQDNAGFQYLLASILEGMGEQNQADAARRQAQRLEAAQP